MTPPRYVVLGAARPRSAWFGALSQWAVDGSLPIEFVKCVGIDEIRTHLASGRRWSAVVVDGGIPGADRDLFGAARAVGATSLVIADDRVRIDWREIGADAVLTTPLECPALLDALATHAPLIDSAQLQAPSPEATTEVSPLAGHVIAVVGAGGTGASTVAMALAQGIGASSGRSVVLADFCLRAELAMLHDSQAVSPGIQEFFDALRTSSPTSDEVRGFAFEVHGRGYDLMLGLRRKRFWAAVRPTVCQAAINTLRSVYDVTVVDTDADVEGEAETGSVDVEERNVLARTALGAADSIVVVGHASLKGLHSLTRVILDLLDHGIPADRLQPVVNQAPQSAKTRAAYASALFELLGSPQTEAVAPPLFLSFRNVDECVRANAPLPNAIADPLAQFALHRLAKPVPSSRPAPRWQRIRTGFLRNDPDSMAS